MIGEDSQNRFDVVLSEAVLGDITPEQFMFEYSMCDMPLMQVNRSELVEYLMSIKDRLTYTKSNLPKHVTLYRASDTPVKNGLSYATCVTVAKKFAKMMLSERGQFLGYGKFGKVEVYSITVDRDDIIYYYNSRNEHECLYVPTGSEKVETICFFANQQVDK
ncbi:hypothetical protein KMW28_27070 [Flammeovirga yaeyamensis]|uniref:Uncharacterized protein n=1 Tax=Flammeovirga yaeyamensis TaxID=367791 RepID=A0AAX1NBJ1_9BACT|nr:hypothetical protein [Flammeovirga yaeyamensis]MBB3700059.1 hypothetical protein [Flammeovirga yaeyamensis]NMF37505.1 hypothetical protein [Flammeovirga yaeyamensis]QWG04562.1 hypothetical protein KMW28_27070 [Flammeovirga yaeyamensis]